MVVEAREARYKPVIECFETLKEQFTPCHVVLHDPPTSSFDLSEISGANVPHHLYQTETVGFICGAGKVIEYFE